MMRPTNAPVANRGDWMSRLYWAFAIITTFCAIASLYSAHAQTPPTIAPVAPVAQPVPGFGAATTEQQNLSLEQANGYTFNPIDVARDPFQAPKNRATIRAGDEKELQLFDINQIDLVAIIRDGRKNQAMVILPNKSSHIVGIGSSIGRRNGRISKITDTEVIVQESFRDFQNRVRTDQTALVLAQ